MEITLGTLADSQPALARLSASKFQASTALKIMRIMRLVKPEMDEYQKIWLETLQKYGVLEGTNYRILPEKVKEFNSEKDALLAEIIKLDFDPIPIDLITAEISSGDLLALEWMFYFGEDAT